jgi:translation initiation factor eIF-2B subunit delta
MGNAIRWLKDVIIKIDPQVTESDAKSHLLSSIDNFILQRITAADELIAASASQKIQAGDVILTYASSSIVQSTLIKAHKAGTPFRVIIVDSKPLFEGRKLARNLAAHGLQVQYSLVSAAAHAVKEATKVFLGAHAMMSNGRLYSRVGTAVVAMLAHERDIPVIVCCESVKFTERVALDSIVGNEVAPAEELLSEAEREALVGLKGKSADSENAADAAGEAGEKGKGEVLKWWREEPNLQMLNILYDVTPAEYIKMVVTEYGSLPPSSVPVVHRISTNT